MSFGKFWKLENSENPPSHIPEIEHGLWDIFKDTHLPWFYWTEFYWLEMSFFNITQSSNTSKENEEANTDRRAKTWIWEKMKMYGTNLRIF